MFKLCFVLLTVTLSLLPRQSDAECCGDTATVFFNARDKHCQYFGASRTNSGKCEITLCGDGELLATGRYCGKGPCNIFGCNCDGGCRHGDAVENFKVLHGDAVYNVFHYLPSL